MEFNIWRAPTDNDRVIRNKWQAAGYHRMTVKCYDATVEETPHSVMIHSTVSLSAIHIQKILDLKITWTISADGTLTSHMDCTRNLEVPFLPRFGIKLYLKNDMNAVEYLGYGPYESYQDKHRASYIGHFTSTVRDLHEDYVKPQENGSHYDCDFVSVENDRIRLTAYGTQDNTISFNASKYSIEELSTVKHNFELTESGYTILCLDYLQSGIGSGSCGPQLVEQYQLCAESFALDLAITPTLK